MLANLFNIFVINMIYIEIEGSYNKNISLSLFIIKKYKLTELFTTFYNKKSDCITSRFVK